MAGAAATAAAAAAGSSRRAGDLAAGVVGFREGDLAAGVLGFLAGVGAGVLGCLDGVGAGADFATAERPAGDLAGVRLTCLPAGDWAALATFCQTVCDDELKDGDTKYHE